MLSRREIIAAWTGFLGRVPSEDTIEEWKSVKSREEAIEILAYCEEFKQRREIGIARLSDAVKYFENAIGVSSSRVGYFSPEGLLRDQAPVKRALLIGTCVFDQWIEALTAAGEPAAVDHVLLNYLSPVKDMVPRPRSDYDFQIVQVPFRIVSPEYETMPLNYADLDGYNAALERSIDRMLLHLEFAMDGAMGVPTFVMNYTRPQQAMFGRLIRQNDIRDPVRYLRAINDALAEAVARYPNAYILDIDQLAGTFGRRFVQDDAFWSLSHGGFINDWDYAHDHDRLEPQLPLSRNYEFDVFGFIQVAWNEAKAMARTLSGAGAVKMVCIDLDDTMWRGVLAERDQISGIEIEGWPLGFVEALSILKKRGIILAIVSKNDEARIAQLWPQLFGTRIALNDFPIRKIGWGPKVESIRAAIAEANILPDSVVFIDDNPVERAAVEATFPEIRTLGASHLDWRRTLLWSAETQTITISAESARRNDMIQAQLVREGARTTLSREAFLDGLGLRIELGVIEDGSDPRFARALELINKTNQFNTNGQRWTQAEAIACLTGGGRWWVFNVIDNYTNYGLVGVIVERLGILEQFVMSCRVFGLEIERAVLAAMTGQARSAGQPALTAQIQETEKNMPCRSVYGDAGWQCDNGTWIDMGTTVTPSHVTLTRS